MNCGPIFYITLLQFIEVSLHSTPFRSKHSMSNRLSSGQPAILLKFGISVLLTQDLVAGHKVSRLTLIYRGVYGQWKGPVFRSCSCKTTNHHPSTTVLLCWFKKKKKRKKDNRALLCLIFSKCGTFHYFQTFPLRSWLSNCSDVTL